MTAATLENKSSTTKGGAASASALLSAHKPETRTTRDVVFSLFPSVAKSLQDLASTDFEKNRKEFASMDEYEKHVFGK